MEPRSKRARLLLTPACSMLLLPVSLGLLPGCGGGGKKDSKAASKVKSEFGQDQMRVRGVVYAGPEMKTFRECESGEELWIEAGGEFWALYEELAVEPYEEIFFLLQGSLGEGPTEGLGAGYAKSLEVSLVEVAAREGPGCGLDLAGHSFRITGNEPFWRLDVIGETIAFSEIGADEGIGFQNAVLERSELGWQWRGRSEDDTHELELAILKEPCRDSMSNSYFHLSARVTLDGRALRGCAARGWPKM